MTKEKVIPLEERVPTLKAKRRQKANRRFVLYISAFFLLILTIVYFQSSLSRVDRIVVKNNHFISDRVVKKANGIDGQTGFWDVDAQTISRRVKNKIGQVQDVSVKKKFPNDIVITVHEYDRIAYVKRDGEYYPVLENGFCLPPLKKGELPQGAPLLVHWGDSKKLKKIAGELSDLPQSIVHRISTLRLTPTKEFPHAVTVLMTDGNTVLATIDRFAEKMKHYPAVVAGIPKGKTGVIHMRVGIYFETYKSIAKDEGDETE